MNNSDSGILLEVVENILKFADATTLAKAESVCSSWKAIVAIINRKYDIWRLCCKEDISEDNLLDLLDKMYPRYWLIGSRELCWRTVYKHWKLWSNLPKRTYITRKIPVDIGQSGPNCIFCIKGSGDWLFIGTKYCLVIYNTRASFITHIPTLGDVRSIYLYSTDVSDDLKYTYLPNLIPPDLMKGFRHDAVLLHITGRAEPSVVLNLDLHTGVAKIEKNQIILVVYDNESLQILEAREAVIDNNYNMNVKNRLKSSTSPVSCYFKLSDLIPLIDHTKIELINFWKNKICISYPSLTGKRFSVLEKHEIADNKSQTYHELSKMLVSDVSSTLYCWQCKIMISMNREELDICVDNKNRKYDTFRTLSLHVTAALFYMNMLFLATDLGIVFMYHVTEPEGLLKLDLTCSTWKVKICKGPIKGLEIMETEPRPTIICNAVTHIYAIEFLSS